MYETLHVFRSLSGYGIYAQNNRPIVSMCLQAPPLVDELALTGPRSRRMLAHLNMMDGKLLERSIVTRE